MASLYVKRREGKRKKGWGGQDPSFWIVFFYGFLYSCPFFFLVHIILAYLIYKSIFLNTQDSKTKAATVPRYCPDDLGLAYSNQFFLDTTTADSGQETQTSSHL